MLQLCCSGALAPTSFVDDVDVSPRSAVVARTVGFVLTEEVACWFTSDVTVTPELPLCAKAATRRLASTVGVTDGATDHEEFRCTLPAFVSTGRAASAPLYARTEPAAPVVCGNENVYDDGSEPVATLT